VVLIVFRAFVGTNSDNFLEITKESVTDLVSFCDEFGFSELVEKVTVFRSQHSSVDESACKRIRILEEHNFQQE